mgnify:CR=1 FL=1
MAVYPAIGMVDVEWPHGSQRMPVEELSRSVTETAQADPPHEDNVPGGAGTKQAALVDPERVAQAYAKKAIYWAAPDRHYKATQGELDSGAFRCPKCKDSFLRPASYKREGGISEKLYGCPTCLFLIRRQELVGHPDCVADLKIARTRLTVGLV